eukprot:symbB.v1.2.028390.t1/scaffold2960.1/size66438/8
MFNLLLLTFSQALSVPDSCEDASALQLRNHQVPSFPGLGPGGNPHPAMTVTNVVFDEETLHCSDPRWTPDSTGIWTFKQIAESFLLYGAKKFYSPGGVPDPLTQCVGALVIAAGECQETLSSEGKGCDAYATKDSGVFQLDFLRSGQIGVRVRPQIEKDGGIMNLCISAFGAGFITAPPWFDKAKEQVATIEGDTILTCAGAPPYVNNYSCHDPLAEPGILYPNFIGPFCHKTYASRWSPCDISQTVASNVCCPMWNGGANKESEGLPQAPFPLYYYQKAETHMNKGANFTKICEEALETIGLTK